MNIPTVQLFMDTETTGLHAALGDRIVEIGLVEFIDRRPTGRSLQLYINPERHVPEDAIRIHGITNEFLADKPVFSEVVDQFIEFCDGAELIIHNASFDMDFLNMELAMAGKPPLESFARSIGDTLVLSRQQGTAKRHSLDALCDRYGIDRKSRKFHGALLDAQLLGEVYVNLTRGQESLDIFSAQASVSSTAAADLEIDSLSLRVFTASDAEVDEHAAYMAQMAKENGGKNIWSDEVIFSRSFRA